VQIFPEIWIFAVSRIGPAFYFVDVTMAVLENCVMSFRSKLLFLMLAAGVTLHSAVAQDMQSQPEGETAPTFDSIFQRTVEQIELDRTFRWLEEQRDDMSRRVSLVGRNLDDWLAGEVVGERTNESYVRLKLNQRVGHKDTYYSNVRISGRVDLPRASERWKLIFESETQENNSLRDQRLSNINASSFTGGFSYEHPERNGWRFNHDVGLKARIPLDPFYRFRIRFDRDISEEWYAGINTKLFYFHNDGWGQDSRFYLNRIFNPSLNLRIQTEVNYRHKERLTEFGQSLSLHHQLGDLETLTYEMGLIGQNRPISKVDNYYMQMVYRRAVYEDWLVMELVPQLISEEHHNWDIDPRVQLNLEVYFFDPSQASNRVSQ